MSKPKVLAFAGSSRTDSFNKKLVKAAAKMAEELGAEVTYFDVKDYPLPIYDGDLEEAEGLPENAKKIKQMMIDADAFLISTPEYNSALSGLLKNLIDWASRSEEGEEGLAAFSGKVAGLMSASPGRLGGIRGLPILRLILSNINVHVVPSQIAFGSAHEGFNDDGSLKDEKMAERVQTMVQQVVETASKLNG